MSPRRLLSLCSLVVCLLASLLSTGALRTLAGDLSPQAAEKKEATEKKDLGDGKGEGKSDGESAKPPAPKLPRLENSIGMSFVEAPAGSFEMGSSHEIGRLAYEHQHAVEITRPFWIGTHEVTQEQFAKVMQANPSLFRRDGELEKRIKDPETGKLLDTKTFPVDSVTWSEAVAFCKKLSALPEEKSAGRSYRLPTEAEWEYACRAGTQTPFAFGESLTSEQANFDGQHPYLTRDDVYKGVDPKTFAGPYLKRPAPIGSYQPNAWGLYDCHGNVREWVADWFSPVYFKSSPKEDPQGPEKGTHRVARGGDWYYFGAAARSAQRFECEPEKRNRRNGFRIVCDVAKKDAP